MVKLVEYTAPTVEPITAGELATHLVVEDPAEDAYLDTLIVTARKALEETYWTQFCTATYDQYFDRFTNPLTLRRSPLGAISSVKYTDTDGTLQTLATSVYEAGLIDGVGIVRLKYEQTWPVDVRGHPDSVVVQFTAGYGAAAAVPEPIKHAIKLECGFLYRNREPTEYEAQAVRNLMGLYSFKAPRR